MKECRVRLCKMLFILSEQQFEFGEISQMILKMESFVLRSDLAPQIQPDLSVSNHKSCVYISSQHSSALTTSSSAPRAKLKPPTSLNSTSHAISQNPTAERKEHAGHADGKRNSGASKSPPTSPSDPDISEARTDGLSNHQVLSRESPFQGTNQERTARQSLLGSRRKSRRTKRTQSRTSYQHLSRSGQSHAQKQTQDSSHTPRSSAPPLYVASRQRKPKSENSSSHIPAQQQHATQPNSQESDPTPSSQADESSPHSYQHASP